MGPLSDKIDSALDPGDHVLKEADWTDPAAHETSKQCPNHEHDSYGQPWKNCLGEEKSGRVKRAGNRALSIYVGDDRQDNPGSRAVERGVEPHHGHAREENEESELDEGPDGPVVDASFFSSKSQPETLESPWPSFGRSCRGLLFHLDQPRNGTNVRTIF